MSTQWLDGFDTYNNNTDLGQNYNFIGMTSIVTANARTGSRALRFAGNLGQNECGATKGIIAADVTCIGGAFRPAATNLHWVFMYMGSSGVITNAFGAMTGNAIRMGMTAGGNLKIDRCLAGVTSTIYTSPNPVFFINTYSYIEVKLDINADEVEVWYNGITQLAVISGIGITSPNRPVFAGWGANNNTNDTASIVDDVYVSDRLLGAQRCYTLFPNADETPQDWALSGGASAFTLIDDVPYNTANYIQGDSVGEISKFGCQNLAVANASINAMRLSSVQFVDISGSAAATQQANIGSGTYIGANSAPSTVAAFVNDMFDLTGVSVADVNNMSLQMERTI